MLASAPITLVAAQAGSADGGMLNTGFFLVLATLALLFLAGLQLFSRRRFDRDTREIVQTLEELRAGHTHRRAEIDAGSPLAVVSDAVHRLGHDLHARLSEAETAAERWRALTDVSKDTAVITTDTDGDIRSFSSGATVLFGWEQDEVISRSAAVIFEESSYKDLLPKLARRSLRSQGITSRSSLVRRDGASFPAEVSVRMLRGTGGDPVGFMMAVRDITEQLRLENDLRESEERYRGLVDGLAEGVLILRDRRLVYVNPAGAALCGKESRELIGTPLRDRIAVGDVLMVEERLSGLEAGDGGEERLVCTLIDDHGKERADVGIIARSADFAGSPAVLLLLQDRSAERRVESELRRNEARLDAVLEAASDGILVLGQGAAGGRVLLTNQAFAEMFRLTTGEILDCTAEELLQRLHERAPGSEPVAELIGAGSATLSRRVSLGGAPPRELQVILSPLVGRRGELLGRVVACRDLTEQQDSERQLQQRAEELQLSKVELETSYRKLNDANDQLRRQAGELDHLNCELRRLDEMKSNLLGNVTHELQTPLVSIRGYTEMILKERLGTINEEQRKGLDLSLRNIDRLISMIDNLAAFTRSESSQTELKLSRFQLEPLIREAADLLRDTMRSKDVRLEIGLGPGELELEADRDRILQVFVNLLSNAVKFNYRGGRIEIAAHRAERGYVDVTVRDTGVGIPAESLGQVFDRRYRVPRSGTGAAEGSGIGLTIVRDILRLHGCTIRVESEPGRGASFSFTLPLARDTKLEPDAPAGDRPPEPERSPPEPPPPEPPPPRRPRLRIIRRNTSKD